MSQDWKQWDMLADRYHHLVGSPSDALRMHLLYPELIKLLGNIQAKNILDIGCGSGHMAEFMARQGANVYAFDTPCMVELATMGKKHPNLHYLAHNATEDFPYHDRFFDIITCTLVLMDMVEIENTLKDTKRVLKENGKVIISILHPCFTPPVGRFRRGLWGRIHHTFAHFIVNHYFSETPSTKALFGENGPLTNYYPRTLSTYAQLFKQAGFVIDNMIEPRPNNEFKRKYPQFFQAEHIPIFLIYTLSPKNRE